MKICIWTLSITLSMNEEIFHNDIWLVLINNYCRFIILRDIPGYCQMRAALSGIPISRHRIFIWHASLFIIHQAPCWCCLNYMTTLIDGNLHLFCWYFRKRWHDSHTMMSVLCRDQYIYLTVCFYIRVRIICLCLQMPSSLVLITERTISFSDVHISDVWESHSIQSCSAESVSLSMSPMSSVVLVLWNLLRDVEGTTLKHLTTYISQLLEWVG